MDATAVGNDYMDNGMATYHICARCVTAFATGSIRYLGKFGCHMPVPSEDDGGPFKEWEDKGIMKCLRCWNLGQDCCVVSVRGLESLTWAILSQADTIQGPREA
jgi:hypothetical protein